ncbi:MAG: DNA ligase D [Anaerolineaceae bacterium]|nr:DNA ligase D [Anaerolineaceae bacterium]MDD4042586.1 DNA ligase D [Anaerolineaceae bacterium]MDD4577229.1 DNA ligase D [Anaerolineaceae bacterium]
MALETYNKKRDFKKTPEPAGKVVKSGEKLRYALQKHAARRLHYDLRLEWNGVLLSWAVPKGPSMNPADKRLAVHVEDHPLDYRTFEGVIPKGEYGAGTVQLFDEGTWTPISDVEQGLKEGELKFDLEGKRFVGRFVLVRIRAKDGEDKNWLLIKEKDEFAQNESGIDGLERSISSDRTMEEIANETNKKEAEPKATESEITVADLTQALPFTTATPMLATLVSKTPSGAGWRHEIKFDGYRLLVFLEGDKVRMITRGGHDWTERFSGLADDFKKWQRPANMVLDGEVVFFDPSGKSDFQRLQSSIKAGGKDQLSFVAFDLLAVGDQDTRSLPLEQRQALLAELMEIRPKSVIPSPYTEGYHLPLFDQLCEKGLEGLISKRKGSLYSGDRSKDWVKSKCVRRQEFVIAGYTRSEKKRSGLSSLLLAVYDDGQLKYAGRTGTGFTDAESVELVKKFRQLLQEEPSVTIPREYRPPEDIFWMKPELVAEVKFAEWTDDEVVRQAVFIGLREDKQPEEVKMEKEEKTGKPVEKKITAKTSKTTKPQEIVLGGVRISSPDKIYDPENNLTKRQVAEYYETIAERMLPHLEKRIVSLVRAPEGITEETFFSRHAAGQIPYVMDVPVQEKTGEEDIYFAISDIKGILGSVQMSAIEFHTWGSRLPEFELPDQLVFDLDPDEGLGLENIRQGVRDLHNLLDQLKLESFLKTSGGKGYHVMVPLQPQADWEAARFFAKNLATEMSKRWPKLYTATMSKAKRKGKIFIDWIRNGRSATSVCVYSLRARPGLPISWPISWDALDEIVPNQVNIQNYPDYIDDDAWESYFSVEQSLK